MMRFISLASAVVVSISICSLNAAPKYTSKIIFPEKGVSAKEVFSAKKVIWLGMDFRRVKCFGLRKDFVEQDVTEPDTSKAIKSASFVRWNQKFYESTNIKLLNKAFEKEVIVDTDTMMKINEASTDPDIFIESDRENTLNTLTITSMIKSYSPSTKDGLSGNDIIGAAVIVKKFNKPKENAEFTLVLLNLQTKTLLMAVDMTGRAQGVGQINHWFEAIRYMLKNLDDDLDDWEDDYNG